MVVSLLHPALLLVLLTSLHAFEFPPGLALQSLDTRATYPGGWALSPDNTASTCPSDAAVRCGGDGYASCCPTGQFCFGNSDNKYCCPTDEDCKTLMNNVPPVCANSSWNMFDYDGRNKNFFCCHAGLIGVKPKYSDPGLCLEADQNISSQQLAMPVSQSGYTATGTPATPARPEATTTEAAPNSVRTGSSEGSSTSGAGISTRKYNIGVVAGTSLALSVYLLH